MNEVILYGILAYAEGGRIRFGSDRFAQNIKWLQCFPCHLTAEGLNERALYAGLAGFNGSVG